MDKRKFLVAAAVVLFLISGFASYKLFFNKNTGFDIEIKNNAGVNISGLAITYEGLINCIELPEIEAGKTYKTNINPEEDFSENSITLYYKDKRGYKQKNTLIGYFEKGYYGVVNVDIISQDKNGLLTIQVEEKIR